MAAQMVDTRIGSLKVTATGGPALPTALLWHSLFVDERTWERVVPELAQQRRLVLVTGPGHGHSGDCGHRYSMEDCADAALEVLEALGITSPVDWVGNAWGGHVGIMFAARSPHRVRTLTTCGTPLHPYSLASRLTTNALLLLYRAFGPARFLADAVVDALLSRQTRTTDPAAAALVRDCFVSAERTGMANAVVSVSLKRVDLNQMLAAVQVPTLLITGSEHPDCSPDEMQAAAALLPNGSSEVVAGAAYLAPIEAPAPFSRYVRDFWMTHQSAGGRP